MKIYPDLLRHLSARYEKIIIVTGTNGKTTTTNLLATILRTSGLQVVHNAEGANMPAGVATALMGQPRDIAVLEVDEGTLGLVTKHVKADMVIITNLLRDQLDRYHELEQLASAMRQALDMLPEAAVFLNADDSLVASMGEGRGEVYYYGLSRTSMSRDTTSEVLEGHICPRCQQPLAFHFYHYSHLGDYYCPSCPYKRPEAHYKMQDLELQPGLSGINLVYPGGSLDLRTPMPGIYNVYNILAAASATLYLKVGPEVIARVVSTFLPGKGRAESFKLEDKHLTLMLVKNPAGLSVTLKSVADIEETRAYLLAINDLAADGRDVSWLWDADISPLLESPYSHIICAGLRAGDMAVCLKYQGADVKLIKVIPEPEESVKALLAEPVSSVIILCTYTNLAVYRSILLRRGAKSETAPVSSLPGTAEPLR